MGQEEQVAGRVARAMRVAGVTQNTLAAATGIARPTLQRRLLGHSPFTVTELYLVAEALDVEAASFLAADREAVTA